MSRAPKPAENIASLVVDLESASRTPAKQRTSKISSLVNTLCSRAAEEGLPNILLERIVDIITLPNQLDQGSLSSLIRNLYPATKVPDVVLIKVVSSLGHGRAKPSYMTQAALLKWLVLVYDVLENPKILSQLYSILFNLLDTALIRPQICHVLSLITQRRHVRPFRIQVLMELSRQVGSEPPLVGLMRVYKDYYPDVIVGEVTSGRASVFIHPNQEWRHKLGEIQEIYFLKTQDGLPPKLRSFRVARKAAFEGGRPRTSTVPAVHTFQAHEYSVTLEEIGDVHEFIWKLEKIELPNQLVAAISDPLLQKFLQLASLDSGTKRIDSWLLAFFEDQLESPGSGESSILDMLSAILQYTRFTKHLPPACFSYLASMLFSWNGITGRSLVLDLLTYIPLGSFDDLYGQIFQSLEEALLQDGTTESRLALLRFYKNLLNEWTSSLLSYSQPPTTSEPAIKSMLNHASNLALTIIQSSTTINTFSEVLDLYESTAALVTYPALKSAAYIALPPAEVIYTIQFTSSLPILSRLCKVLALLKRAFEISTENNKQAYPKGYINRFNGFLMDVCNCLWRSKAFTITDQNATGCSIAPSVTRDLGTYILSLDQSLSLVALFSFSFSPVFSLLAISYIRELEDSTEDGIVRRHAGPVTQKSLAQLEKDGGLSLPFQEYKLGVLRYMETKSVTGIGELMYNTMKHLMTGKSKV